MDDLPESLLMEVLLRLPFVALHRFKLVCKKWLSLTSTPYFHGKYKSYASRGSISPRWAFVSRFPYDCSKRYPVQAHELLIDLHCGDLKCPIPSNDEDMLNRGRYRIIGVSNGLVLYLWSTGNHEHGTNWGVCDPVTKQCVVLPPGITKPRWEDSYGFLTQMKDGVVASYTVVKYASKLRRFEIFLSETGEWKAYAASHFYINNMFAGLYAECSPTDLDGILHWMHSFQGIFAHDPHRNPGALREIHLPADRDIRIMKEFRTGICGTRDGHLRYLESYALSVSVWVLHDYGCGDNWVLQHRATNILRDARQEDKTLKNNIKLQPVSFHPFDPDVVYLGCNYVFVSYNMRESKSQVLKTFRAIRNGKKDYKWDHAFCLVIPPIPPSIPSPSPRE